MERILVSAQTVILATTTLSSDLVNTKEKHFHGSCELFRFINKLHHSRSENIGFGQVELYPFLQVFK